MTRVSPAPPTPASAGPVSLTVLPFGNPAHVSGDELLAGGIPESILHRLAGMRGLRLVAHDAESLEPGGEWPGDVRMIGRRVGARYLVQGSVQHAGSSLRITVQLIDTSDGSQLWSLRFDRAVADVFALEDEVAQQVACAVCQSLLGDLDVQVAARAAVVPGGT